MKMLLVLFAMTSFVYAESFLISGSLYDFEEKDGLLLKGCQKDCLALKTIKSHTKIDLKKVRAGETFHNSLGSDVCSLVYKASSVLGVAQNKDRRAFCVFKDESLVEINSLTDYLKQKKILRE